MTGIEAIHIIALFCAGAIVYMAGRAVGYRNGIQDGYIEKLRDDAKLSASKARWIARGDK